MANYCRCHSFLAIWMAVISVKDHRYLRLYGTPRGAIIEGVRDNSYSGWPGQTYPKV